MIRPNQTNDFDTLLDDASRELLGNFEKIRRNQRPMLPTSDNPRRARSARETAASRKAKKRISEQNAGMHRRRRRKVQ